MSRIARVVTGDGGIYRTISEAHAAHRGEYYGRGARVVRLDGTVWIACVGGAWPVRQQMIRAAEGPEVRS